MTKEQFLAFSLPYGLKAEFTNTFGEVSIGELDGYYVDGYLFDCCRDEDAKPILHPLSDLTKEIEHKGEEIIPIVKLLEHMNFNVREMELDEIREYEQSFKIVELITLRELPLYLEWHFDLFGGIDSGDAIDVNTLETNPYK
jgi:hypothetical protein